MIGSRLLFSGYGGVGRYYRSTQAGLLGQDALIVIDEAQLSPTFVTTAIAAYKYQRRSQEIRRSWLMRLSATILNHNESDEQDEKEIVFGKDEIADDYKNEIARKRLMAEKRLVWHPVKPESDVKESSKAANERFANAIVESAAKFFNQSTAVIIYLKTVELVNVVEEKLAGKLKAAEIADAKERILKITDEMRGYERDDLVKNNKIYKYFKPKENRVLTEGCRFIIATAAAEVGVNIDAEHGICDLVAYERMIQRFGRINRLGNKAATTTVMYDEAQFKACDVLEKNSSNEAAPKGKNAAQPIDRTAYYAHSVLQSRADEDGGIDVSPTALREIENDERAWSVPPHCPPLDSAQLDDWSLTTLNQNDYARPLVAYWLRGVTADNSATTTFCWRADLQFAASIEDDKDDIVNMVKAVPVAPQEKADVAVHRAIALVKKLAEKFREKQLVIIDGGGTYEATTLEKICGVTDGKVSVKDDELHRKLSFATLILPNEIGGLDSSGNPLQELPKTVTRVEDRVDSDLWRRLVITQEGKNFVAQELDADGEEKAIDNELPNKFPSPKAIVKAYCKQWKRQCHFISNKGESVNTNDADDGDDSNVNVKHHKFVAYLLKRDAPEQFSSNRDESSLNRDKELSVTQHNADARRCAEIICEKLNLDSSLASAIILAASRHDNGKARLCWQRAIGNENYDRENIETALAKSGKTWFDQQANAGYRHEFGSLIEATRDVEINRHPHRELILHLIAAHHGYARPYFPDRAFDREEPDSKRFAFDTMQRFARLQRQYGWWQLAYLESLLKAADGLASRANQKGTQ